MAEDGTSPQNTQSETSVAVSGQKVVVGYNDSLVCCFPAVNLGGYSVSTNSGSRFTDEGTLPFRPDVQPIGDPTVAADGPVGCQNSATVFDQDFYAARSWAGRGGRSWRLRWGRRLL